MTSRWSATNTTGCLQHRWPCSMTSDSDFLAVQIVTDNVRLRLGDDRAHGTLHTPLFDVVSKALGCARGTLTITELAYLAMAVSLTPGQLLTPYCGFGEWRHYSESSCAFVNPQGAVIAKLFRERSVSSPSALWCADVTDASRNVYAWQTFLDDRASALRFCELHLFQAERFKA